MGLEAILGADDARGVVAIMARAPGSPALRKALLRYVGLFAPAKRQIGWDRVEKLLGEIVDLIEIGRIPRNGQLHAAPPEYWSTALDTLFTLPGLRRPLKTHGLLLEIIAGLSSKAEAKAETTSMQQRSGATPVGNSSAHKPFAPESPAPKSTRNPEAAIAALAEAKSILSRSRK